MKNQDIISAYEGLYNLRQGATQRLPARTSFAIIRNLKLLQPIVEDIQIAYNDILTKYADPIEDNKFRVKEGHLEEFNQEVASLYNLETEAPIIKIKFSDIESLEFSLTETEALLFMIEDGEA